MLKGYVAPLFHIGTYVTWLVVLRQEKFELRKIAFEDSMARLNPDPEAPPSCPGAQFRGQGSYHDDKARQIIREDPPLLSYY